MGPLETPAAEEVLVQTAQRLAAAGHGKKGAIARAAATQLGVSVQAVYGALRKRRYGMRQVSADGTPRRRKRRRDACQSVLSLDEARAIAAYICTSERNTGKVLASIQAALDSLRANGEVLAGRVDTDTGEFHPLSVSAVARALRWPGTEPISWGARTGRWFRFNEVASRSRGGAPGSPCPVA